MSKAKTSEAASYQVSEGIATIMHNGSPIMTITKANDGTFGWRSHGRMDLIGRDGSAKKGYKFRKGIETPQAAIAGAICYLGKVAEVIPSTLEIIDYIAPERGFSPNRKLENTEAYAEAMKLTKKLKMPASMKKAISA